MAQTDTADTTKVRLKDGTTLVLKGKLSPDQVSQKIGEYRAQQAQSGGGYIPPNLKPPPSEPSNSWIAGMGGRAYDALSGLVKSAIELSKPPTSLGGEAKDTALQALTGGTPAYKLLPAMVKGAYEDEKAAGGQALEYAKRSWREKESDPIGFLSDEIRSQIAAASMLDPFATGSVANVNRLTDAGLNRRAAGEGMADVLMLALGGRKGKKVSERTRLANLVSATGPSGETLANYKTVLPDLDQTASVVGAPKNLRDVLDVVDKTGDSVDQEFNRALFPIRNQQVIPIEIANKILDQITPDMIQTAEGRAERAELINAAKDYSKPWTLNQLNALRSTNNKRLTAFYKGDTQAMAAGLTRTQTAVLKAARDGAADIVYNMVDEANPGFAARGLKAKQAALWDLQDQLGERVGALADAQAVQEGKTLRQKVSPTAYAGPSRISGYVHGVQNLIPGGGPENEATRQVGKAFKSPTASLIRRRAILAAPLAAGAGGSNGTP